MRNKFKTIADLPSSRKMSPCQSSFYLAYFFFFYFVKREISIPGRGVKVEGCGKGLEGGVNFFSAWE